MYISYKHVNTKMSYQGSPFSAVHGPDDYEMDEDNEEYLDEERDVDDQDESDEGKCLYSLVA